MVWVELEGETISFGLSLILDILLPSDKQYEWDIFKEHESVKVHTQVRWERLCPSKFLLFQRAFTRCAAGTLHEDGERGVKIS